MKIHLPLAILVLAATACTPTAPTPATVGDAPDRPAATAIPVTAIPSTAAAATPTGTAATVADADTDTLTVDLLDLANSVDSPEVAALMTAGIVEVIEATETEPADAPDTARTDVLAAFDQALLRLTFTAKDGGQSIEILIENRTAVDLALYVAPGETNFADSVAIASPSRLDIDVPASGSATITVGQGPSVGRMTGGSVTLERSEPKR